MRDIGKNIRALRLKKDLTQDQLAELLFVTRQTVSNYETGKSRPDVDMLVKISQVLEVEIHEVIYGPTAPKSQKRLYWKLGIGAVLTVLFFAFAKWLTPIAYALGSERYLLGPSYIVSGLLLPLFYFFLGWTLMHLVELVAKAKPVSTKWANVVSWLLLLVFGIWFIFTVITSVWMAYFTKCAVDAHNAFVGFDTPPIVNMWLKFWANAGLYGNEKIPMLLAGGLLWLFSGKKSAEKVEKT